MRVTRLPVGVGFLTLYHLEGGLGGSFFFGPSSHALVVAGASVSPN